MIALPDEHTDALITMLAARNGQLISTLHALRLDLHDLIDGGTECSGDDTRISLAIRRIEDALSPAPASSVGDVHVHSTQSPSSAGGGPFIDEAEYTKQAKAFVKGEGPMPSVNLANGMCWEDVDEGMFQLWHTDEDGHRHPVSGGKVQLVSEPTLRPRTAWKLAWLLLGVIALLGLIGLVF
ncbi:MAG: hypothetical protein GY944_07755 [bacterium]|nr:hypothetical protein [bacterium]